MGPVIGVLGGMGPMATLELMKKIIVNTPAIKDQEHYKMLVYNNPHIPSRVEAILNQANSPLPDLIASAKLLQRAGASFIVMPCHTAHFWYEEIANEVEIPVYNLIDVTVKHVVESYNIINNKDEKNNKLLIIATSATIKTKLYQNEFNRYGLDIVVPTESEQKIIVDVIDLIKAGGINAAQLQQDFSKIEAIQQLNNIIKKYRHLQVELLLAGCTEISSLLPCITDDIIKIDPLEIVANKIIKDIK